MNPEADLRMHDRFGEPVLFVVALADKSTVWLEGEDDFDLGNELEERYKAAFEEQMDELDFYTELVEIGITEEIIRKYMGDEKAEIFKEFCEEHGLI